MTPASWRSSTPRLRGLALRVEAGLPQILSFGGYSACPRHSLCHGWKGTVPHLFLNRPTHAKMAAWSTASRWVRTHMPQTTPNFFLCRCTFEMGMGLLEAVGDQAKPLQCQEMGVSPNIHFKLVGFPGVRWKIENLICFHSVWARHNQQMRDSCLVWILFLLTKMCVFFQIFCSLEFCLWRSSTNYHHTWWWNFWCFSTLERMMTSCA